MIDDLRNSGIQEHGSSDETLIKKVLFALLLGLLSCLPLQAQTFSIETISDTLSYLMLTTDSTCDRWPLPYPVYQFQTGDIDGDGREDAMVGVVKKTRFYREIGRRLFIFKNYRGKVRPLWMGSKLGGELVDFKSLKEGKEDSPTFIRALETDNNGRYAISDYRWEEFGMAFDHFIETNIDQKDTAYEKFHSLCIGADDGHHDAGTTTR